MSSPALAFGGRRSLRLIERNLYVYKHGWMMLLSGFFEPLFYLVGIGFGLGALVGTLPGPDGEPISYQLFVAPALLASAAMNGAINESTFNFFFKLNYNKTFTSILSTPLSPGDIALGELGWALIRGGLYALGFHGRRCSCSGCSSRRGCILAVPAALLVGFAFGAAGMAATSFMRTWQDFDLIQLVVLPMFLFSGTFFPIDAYPEALQLFVRLTPLYQGVDLIRSLTVGAISPALLVNVAYLRSWASSAWPSRRVVSTGSCSSRPVTDGAGRDRARRARGADRRDRRRAAAARAWSNGASSVAREKVRRFRDEHYWGAAGTRVRRSGRPDPAGRAGAGGPRRQPDRARLHRAMRRAISCGRALHAQGLADRPVSQRADDGLTLTDAYIAAAVRCAPPANKPTIEERDACAPYLARELDAADRVHGVVVALGAFGWDAALRALAALGHSARPKPRVRARRGGRRSGRYRSSGPTTRASRTRSPDASRRRCSRRSLRGPARS